MSVLKSLLIEKIIIPSHTFFVGHFARYFLEMCSKNTRHSILLRSRKKGLIATSKIFFNRHVILNLLIN